PVRLLHQSGGVRVLAPERRGHHSGTRAETLVEPSPRVVAHEGERLLVEPRAAANVAKAPKTRGHQLSICLLNDGKGLGGALAAPGRDDPRRAELSVTRPIRAVAHEGEPGRVLQGVATRTRARARDHELAVVLPHDGTGSAADHRERHPGTTKARIEVSRCGPDPRGDCEDGKHERDDMAPAAFQSPLPMRPLRYGHCSP